MVDKKITEYTHIKDTLWEKTTSDTKAIVNTERVLKDIDNKTDDKPSINGNGKH